MIATSFWKFPDYLSVITQFIDLFLQIPVKKDLPVGDNLHDHVTTMLGPFLVDKPILFDIVRSATPSVVWQYLAHGSGPLAATVACDSMGFLRYATVDWSVTISFLPLSKERS